MQNAQFLVILSLMLFFCIFLGFFLIFFYFFEKCGNIRALTGVL